MEIYIEHNVPLAPKTTMGVGGAASHFVSVNSVTELTDAYEYAEKIGLRTVILGGGSNVVVPDTGIDALIIHPVFSEISFVEDSGFVNVTAGSGVDLDDLIKCVVEKQLWGLENLSGVPGSVGGVPIQNVGAYGVEAKDVVTHVHVYNPVTHIAGTLSNAECEFKYRDSLFKQRGGKHLVVTHVTFQLSKTASPNIGYKDLALAFQNTETPSLSEIRDEVIAIRKGKFPDWHVIGTAGSFFKNPIVSKAEFERVKAIYPELPGFPQGENIKIPLGWILDRVLELKGYRIGNVGLYEKQALVVVNYGGATAEEIISFGDNIIRKIFDATSISIEREAVFLA